jgi:hypothetical protein
LLRPYGCFSVCYQAPEFVRGANRPPPLADVFTKGKGVQAIEMVAPDKGISAALINVEPSATGDNDFKVFAPRIIESF